MKARGLLAVVLFLVCFGLFQSDFSLSEYPKSAKSVLTIVANMPGASSELVEQRLTSNLEKALASTAGVTQTRSYSRANRASIFLEFKSGTNLDTAFMEVSSRLARLRLDEPAQIYRTDLDEPAFMHLVAVNLSSTQAQTLITKLEQQDGVASISTTGEPMSELKVTRLDSRVPLQSIVDYYSSSTKPWSSIAEGALVSQVQDLEVISKEEALLEEQVDNIAVETSLNSQPAIMISIRALADANIVELGQRIRQAIADNDNVSVFIDNTVAARSALNHFYIALSFALLIIALVVSYFVSMQATIMILLALAINVALMAYLSVFGVGLNIITMMALVVAVGFMIDDAIVMAEGLAQGKTVKQMIAPIVAISAVLAAVFTPALLINGELKPAMHDTALVMIVSVGISCLVACFVIPAFASLINFQLKNKKFTLPKLPVKAVSLGIVAIALTSSSFVKVDLMPAIERDYLIVRHAPNEVVQALDGMNTLTQVYDSYALTYVHADNREELRDKIKDLHPSYNVFMPKSRAGVASNENLKIAVYSSIEGLCEQLESASFVKQAHLVNNPQKPTYVYQGEVTPEQRLVVIAMNDGLFVDGVQPTRIYDASSTDVMFERYFGANSSLSEAMVERQSESMIRRINKRRAELISVDTNNNSKVLALLDAHGVDYSVIGAGNNSAVRELVPALFFAFLAAFVVLVVLFDSFVLPLYSLIPAVFALMGTSISAAIVGFSLPVFIGMICAVGLVVKHSVLIMSEQGTVYERVNRRLRPIYLTTAATIIGALPLLLMGGAVAPITRALAVSLIISMMLGTFGALYVLPSFLNRSSSNRITTLPKIR